MAASFEGLSGEAGLKQLDEYLLPRSYITGFQASRDDLAVYLALEKAPAAQFQNANRWYSHITALLESSFPGKAAGVKIAGSAATTATPATTSREAVAPPATPPTPEAAAEESAGAAAADDDDDDLDLFGEETEEDKAAAAEREAQQKAAGKKKQSGKSSVLMDVKPWDDETDMKKLEEAVRSIKMEGLLWELPNLFP